MGSSTVEILSRLFLLKRMAPGLRLCVGSALNNEFIMSANTLDIPPGGLRLVLRSSRDARSGEEKRINRQNGFCQVFLATRR